MLRVVRGQCKSLRRDAQSLMGCGELAGQAPMYVRGGERFADQGDRDNSYHDRGAFVDVSPEDVLRRVDLRRAGVGSGYVFIPHSA
jgi:hypothetical protein